MRSRTELASVVLGILVAVASPSFAQAQRPLAAEPQVPEKAGKELHAFRWEYVKGSTLFLVWNMSTLDPARPGVFSALRDLGGAFTGSGTHVFMVKMNYWLGL